MLGLAALLVAATPASIPAATPADTPRVMTTQALTTTSPWWEKITYTFAKGSQSCLYESNLPQSPAQSCGTRRSAEAHDASSRLGSTFTKITIERRFSPAENGANAALNARETLLGGRVMALAIDGNGRVRSCTVVAVSGGMEPPFGCREARGERYEASTGHLRQAVMTVLVYGHEEHLA